MSKSSRRWNGRGRRKARRLAAPGRDGTGRVLRAEPLENRLLLASNVDINPFHNPYLKGDLVLPELASAYIDRTDVRPGMIQPGDVVVEAFAAIGWAWGGDWNSLKDWMHFSASGG